MTRRLRRLVLVLVAILGPIACSPQPPPASKALAAPAQIAPAAPPAAPVAAAALAWTPNVPQIATNQVAATLRQAGQNLAAGQVEEGEGPGPGALELYLAVLGPSPANAEAEIGIDRSLEALFERGGIAARLGRLREADRIAEIARQLRPGHADFPRYRQMLDSANVADQRMREARELARLGKLLTPAKGNAVQRARAALQAFPDFWPARSALEQWQADRLRRAAAAAKRDDYVAAGQFLDQAQGIAADPERIAAARSDIAQQQQARSAQLLALGNGAVDALQLDDADRRLAEATAVWTQAPGVEALRQRIHLARHYGPFKPLQVFSETTAIGGVGPAMVVIPYGRFDMGSPDSETGHQLSEAPQHNVEFVRGFAMARSEVTVGEYRRFIASSNYRTVATRRGRSTVYDERGGALGERGGVDWRRDHAGNPAPEEFPVVHIAFEDAVAYADWLSAQTGHRYRLPSEAEFEYALRAGGNSAYPWGEAAPTRVVGNLTGDGDASPQGRRWGNAIAAYRDGYWGLAPVHSFSPEGFGTYDLTGNAAEWVLDCWHDSYQRAPVDGSAWVNPGCPARVARGASWASALEQARSAFRLSVDAGTSNARLGFRVVREL